MKYSSLFAGLVITGALVAVSFATPGQPSGGEQAGDPQKDARAQEIEALRQKNDALALELADTQHALENVIQYLNAQSESAQAMEAVLDDAEKKGFAVGENWPSRVALLGGWRAQLAAQQKDLPALPGSKAGGPANGTNGGPAKTPPKN